MGLTSLPPIWTMSLNFYLRLSLRYFCKVAVGFVEIGKSSLDLQRSHLCQSVLYNVILLRYYSLFDVFPTCPISSYPRAPDANAVVAGFYKLVLNLDLKVRKFPAQQYNEQKGRSTYIKKIIVDYQHHLPFKTRRRGKLTIFFFIHLSR